MVINWLIILKPIRSELVAATTTPYKRWHVRWLLAAQSRAGPIVNEAQGQVLPPSRTTPAPSPPA